MSDGRQPEVVFFAPLSRDFEQIFGQIVSIRVKTLSNTNLMASRHIKREKRSLPVDVRRSKTWDGLGGGGWVLSHKSDGGAHRTFQGFEFVDWYRLIRVLKPEMSAARVVLVPFRGLRSGF